MTDWVCIRQNVSVCKECGNLMSLWKNKRTGQYSVMCEFCPNEYIPENKDILSACITVPIDSPRWKEKLCYDKNTAIKNLMNELYIRYLSGGDEYMVRFEEVEALNERNMTKNIVVSLHIGKVEE